MKLKMVDFGERPAANRNNVFDGEGGVAARGAAGRWGEEEEVRGRYSSTTRTEVGLLLVFKDGTRHVLSLNFQRCTSMLKAKKKGTCRSKRPTATKQHGIRVSSE
jgi:hypothetical protein